MGREINLDGGEVQMLKAIGLGGSSISGEQLLDRVSGFDEADFIDTLQGLMMMGYVIADKQAFHGFDDVKKAEFHVNSGYSKALRDSIDPRAVAKPRSRRVRRE